MKKLLLTLVACVTALAANAWTVYYSNFWNWNPVYIWAWKGGTNYTGGSYPGKEMTKDSNGLYSYSEDSPATTLQFNQKGDGNKTGDFTLKDGAYYNYFGELPSVVYMIGNVGSYAWNPTEGIEIPAESPGIYVLNGVKINDTFAFTTQLSSSGSDWDTCNNNRYGPDNGSVPVSINNSYDVTTHGNSMNSWKIDNAGTYKVTLNLITNKIYIDPVDLYIAGNNINGESQWGSQANEPMGELMTSKDGIEYTWSGSILGSDFKIYDGDWDSEFDYGTEQNAGTTLTLGVPYSVVQADGCDNIILKGLSWIQNPVVTFNKDKMTVTVKGNKPLYLRGEKILGGNPWEGEQTGAWDINNSYLFQLSTNSSGTAVYTLTVGSINAGDSFKIATEDWEPTYTFTGVDATALKIENDYDLTNTVLSEADRTTQDNMALAQGLLNATFTLTMDANPADDAIIDSNIGPFTKGAYLYIEGTTTEEAKNEWVLTPGNDKTMQEGTVEGNEIKITTIEGNKGALVLVYPPEGAVNVYFKLGNGAQSEKRRLTAAELTGFTQAANYPGDDNAYMLPLPVGSGEATLYYEKEGGELSDPVTYNYNVKEGVTTGVDCIGTDEEDAVYYNLQGVKVDNPEKGIFVKVVNGTASKVVL